MALSYQLFEEIPRALGVCLRATLRRFFGQPRELPFLYRATLLDPWVIRRAARWSRA